jgi:hypothetical protein
MVPTTKIDSFGSTINRKEVPRGFKKTKHKSTGLPRKNLFVFCCRMLGISFPEEKCGLIAD